MKIQEVHTRSSEKGATLVEFAVVFPVAMMMIFGLIDLSLYFYYQSSMTNVARSTLRYTVTGRYAANPSAGGTNPDWLNRKQSAINEATRSLTPLLSLTPPKGEILFVNPDTGVALDNDLGGPGGKVKVIINQKISFLTPFAALIGSTTNVSGVDVPNTNYNLQVSTVYKSEGYVPKGNVTP